MSFHKTKIHSYKYRASLALAGLLAISMVTPVLAIATPANPAAGSTYDQRLAQRKTEQNEQLDTNTTKHVQSTCVAEQAGIRKLQASTTTAVNNRNSTYLKVNGIILVAIGSLKLNNTDTFSLEQVQGTYAQKIAAFSGVATNYQQTLNDLLLINCAADPVGFQALLDTARAYYKQLSSGAADVRNYVANNVQTSLQTYMTQLQSGSSAASSAGGNQ